MYTPGNLIHIYPELRIIDGWRYADHGFDSRIRPYLCVCLTRVWDYAFKPPIIKLTSFGLTQLKYCSGQRKTHPQLLCIVYKNIPLCIIISWWVPFATITSFWVLVKGQGSQNNQIKTHCSPMIETSCDTTAASSLDSPCYVPPQNQLETSGNSYVLRKTSLPGTVWEWDGCITAHTMMWLWIGPM